MPSRTRRVLSRIVPRGPALSAWTVRQYRRLERAYCKEVLRVASHNLHAKRQVRAQGSVRSILVIADCLWEQNELVPDLERKWEIALLDLGPHLSQGSSCHDAEIVLRTVESFIAANRSLQPDVILFYTPARLCCPTLYSTRCGGHGNALLLG